MMVGALALIGALGVWDEDREARAALQDFEREQSALAVLIATNVGARLDLVRLDALRAVARPDEPSLGGLPRHYEELRVVPAGAPRPSSPEGRVLVSVPAEAGRRADVVVRVAQLLAGVATDAGESLALVQPPGGAFYAPSGLRYESRPLRDALEGGRAATWLTRPQAAALGLPERVAVAGTAWAGAAGLGRWGVAVVASAAPERDRQTRARWRLVIGVVLAGGLVLTFGGYAMRAQRKELELQRELTVAELEKQRDQQLEREGRAVTMLTLAAGVAHEISTPLSVIHGRAEQLHERAVEERDARAAQRILEQAARIEGVIRGFLKLARGDAPTLQRLDPSDVVREAAALVEHRFAKAGVRLAVEAAGELPAVRGDHRLLEHALVNLLLNACDACARGGSVRLAAGRDPGEGAAVFVVDDDGVGIDPSAVAQVTEPFFSTKAPGEGTGLGLAIASEIVKIHRGVLTLAPREPRGTRATVRLPAVEGAPDANA